MSRMKIEKNIAWDEKRQLYYVTLYFGTDTNGKTVKKTITTKSKKNAQKLLRDHRREMESGIAVMPTKSTLSEYAKDFIEYKALSLSETTVYGYRNIIKNHIDPCLGQKNMQEITTRDIQSYVASKVKEGISLQSVKKHVALLYSIFHNAYVSRIVGENPLEYMERIKAPPSAITCMNAAEISALCASVSGTQLEVPVKLAAYLGLRRGEVLGIKWEHVDFDNAVLYICNTRTKAGTKIIEKGPKTERSTRQLYLPKELLEVLKRHKHLQDGIFLKTDNRHDYVVSMDSGKPFSPNYLSESFHKHLVKNNFKIIRFHDLRHPYVKHTTKIFSGAVSLKL